MILSKQIFKNSLKRLRICRLAGLSVLLIIGGFAHNHLYASTITPVDYNISELTSTLYRQAPTGYVKPSYQYKISNSSTQATATELSAADAAEIMSQEIYRYLKVDITGKTIELSHGVSTISSRPGWHGTLQMDSLCTIRLFIDSVTGEISFIKRQLAQPTTFETSQTIEDLRQPILSNLDASCKKVKDLIAASDYLPEKIKSVIFDGSTRFYVYEGPTGKEKIIGITRSHIFNVTTVSDKTYQFILSEDLTRIDSIVTPEYLTAFNATISTLMKQKNWIL